MKRYISFTFVVGLAVLGLTSTAYALPRGLTETRFVRGLNTPTSMTFSPDGRLFVTEKGGALRIVKNGTLLTKPFLTVRTDENGERGLLSVTFDPQFSTNRFLYVYYTVPGSPAHNRVSRFRASATNPDVVESRSERPILNLDALSSATNHNGGSIHFGPDGKLYVAVGENANSSNSQKLTNRLGKILRINSNGTIPTDNPFYRKTTGANRTIWALGLRNPYTFSFDPRTGKMYINDVGQNLWEEVDRGLAGMNYGWPTCEGRCSVAGMKNPTFQYSHNGGSAAITGGTFYRGSKFPAAYTGAYFFSDYIFGRIWWLDTNQKAHTFTTKAKSPVDLDTGPDGQLYYLSIGDGAVYKIAAN